MERWGVNDYSHIPRDAKFYHELSWTEIAEPRHARHRPLGAATHGRPGRHPPASARRRLRALQEAGARVESQGASADGAARPQPANETGQHQTRPLEAMTGRPPPDHRASDPRLHLLRARREPSRRPQAHRRDARPERSQTRRQRSPRPHARNRNSRPVSPHTLWVPG